MRSGVVTHLSNHMTEDQSRPKIDVPESADVLEVGSSEELAQTTDADATEAVSESTVNPQEPEATRAEGESEAEEVPEVDAFEPASAEPEQAPDEAAEESAGEAGAAGETESTEQEAVVEAAPEEEAAVEAPPAAAPRPIVGFTGQITGRVYTLAELEQVTPVETEQHPDELQKLYESTLTSVNEHDIVAGTVVSVGDKDVVIDIGFKSDGIIPRNEFDEEVLAGMAVEVYLERLEDRQGQLVLSKRRADELRRWQRIEDAFENDTIVEGLIVNRIKGGMVVDLFGTEAFLPGSQIDIRPVRDFDAYLGKRMEFKVVKLNPVNGNVVVSHKALIEKDLNEQREKILAKMEPGQILEGIVKNITDFGVFIDLGGVDGLLHITDLSWGRVSHPSEMVELDEKLNVVVLDYDKERQRISLGLKQLQSHPWEKIEEKFAENQVIEGKVVSITDYGAFVELEKGIEGLVHISEMSWTQHIRHPSEVVGLGSVVQVKILKIDQDARKISLGMKQLEPDPWEQLAERHPPGSVAHGAVRNITNFGIFVEIEPGVDGLVHISDLSWTKKIRHPSEVVKKGQELDVMVLDIDVENRRLSLGHKQVETNPWNQFSVAYAQGVDTSGKVVRFEENGIVVELPLEVEAFVPSSQLIREGHHDAYNVGDELDLRVIEFDGENRKIVLSERRKVEEEEMARRRQEETLRRKARDEERRTVDTFSRGEQSGPTTLAEISGLAALKAKMEEAEAREKSEVKKGKAKKSRKDETPEAETAPEPVAAAEEAPAENVPVAETESPAKATAEANAETEAEVGAEPVSEVTEGTDAQADVAAEPAAEAAAEPAADAAADDATEAEAEKA